MSDDTAWQAAEAAFHAFDAAPNFTGLEHLTYTQAYFQAGYLAASTELRTALAAAEARAETAEAAHRDSVHRMMEALKERNAARADCAALREALRPFAIYNRVTDDELDKLIEATVTVNAVEVQYVRSVLAADHPGAPLLAAFKAIVENLEKAQLSSRHVQAMEYVGAALERGAEGGAVSLRRTKEEAARLHLPGWNLRCNRCGSYGARWVTGTHLGWGALALCDEHYAELNAERLRHDNAMHELCAVNYEQEATQCLTD